MFTKTLRVSSFRHIELLMLSFCGFKVIRLTLNGLKISGSYFCKPIKKKRRIWLNLRNYVLTTTRMPFESKLKLAGIRDVFIGLSAPSKSRRQISRPRHAFGQSLAANRYWNFWQSTFHCWTHLESTLMNVYEKTGHLHYAPYKKQTRNSLYGCYGCWHTKTFCFGWY